MTHHSRAVTWHPAGGGIRRFVVLEQALLVDREYQ